MRDCSHVYISSINRTFNASAGSYLLGFFFFFLLCLFLLLLVKACYKIPFELWLPEMDMYILIKNRV
jgi:hypothetical protein